MNFNLQRFSEGESPNTVSNTSSENSAENGITTDLAESTNNANKEEISFDIESKINTALEKMQNKMLAAFKERFKKKAANISESLELAKKFPLDEMKNAAKKSVDGAEKFISTCAKIGIDGIILPDSPFGFKFCKFYCGIYIFPCKLKLLSSSQFGRQQVFLMCSTDEI